MNNDQQLNFPTMNEYVVVCSLLTEPNGNEIKCYYVNDSEPHWSTDINKALRLKEKDIQRLKNLPENLEDLANKDIENYNKLMNDYNTQQTKVFDKFSKARTKDINADPEPFADYLNNISDKINSKKKKLVYLPEPLISHNIHNITPMGEVVVSYERI